MELHGEFSKNDPLAVPWVVAARAVFFSRNVTMTISESEFPAMGHRFLADYGELAFHVDFAADGSTLRWASANAADFDAEAKTEHYLALCVRPGVFWVTWKEADGTTVTHVEDFENGRLHAAITLPDHGFLTLSGNWTRLD